MKWEDVGILAVAALFVALVVGLVYQELKHPCLEYQQYQTTCGGDSYCGAWDAKGNCLFYSRNPTYPCTESRCVRRKE